MSSTLNLTNLNYEEKNIGNTFKISKRHFVWEFDLNGASERIELFDSRLSGKKKLIKNGVLVSEEVDQGSYMKTFDINGHQCVIIQYGDKIELRIDNQSFTHLYNLQKNKQLFAGQKGPTSNIYVAKPFDKYSSDDQKKKNNDASLLYKVNKPEEQNKPQLFNFSINKNESKHAQGFKKFKFGAKIDNEPSTQKSTNNNNDINTNSNNENNNNANNKGGIDLLGFDDVNQTNSNSNNNNINNNQNQNQNNNQNILDLGSLSNPVNNNINNNSNNNMNNNNLLSGIFLSLPDNNINNQQQNFNQNNLDFILPNNNNSNNANPNPMPQNEEYNYPGMDEIFGNNQNQNNQNPTNNDLFNLTPNNLSNSNQNNNGNNQMNNVFNNIF